ncbi:hypothetical protein OG730_43500 (plasmid) [Streptomyces sp. NBC_01298]|uniref:hypothetical protein n=1 Tax=Streptomyces sp. NBC_01298 TaxID=2903817 RepID=UPI002E102ED2|nr:hypothetical protein OG730_43500 [Streptomyces sp. NBC_01298]
MSDRPEPERVECTECFAQPHGDNMRIAYVKAGGGMSETWHSPECSKAITWEDLQKGAEQVREQDAWAKGVFPAAHERLERAAAAMPADSAAQPFVAALTELVREQAGTTGFVGLHSWVEILERHFPPDLPDPDRTTE